MDNADDLAGIHPNALGPDAIFCIANRNRAAMWRRFRFVDIMKTKQLLGMATVDFDQNPFCLAEEGRSGADAGGEENLSIWRDIGRLDDGPVQLSQESIAHVLRQE
jgi:hypothetical protein